VLRGIFSFCQGFDGRVNDAVSFGEYIADCQLETTMSFNDYYVDAPNLPSWPSNLYIWIGGISAAVFVLGLIALIVGLFAPSLVAALRHAGLATIVAGIVLVAVIATAYLTVMAAGAKPFPTAPDSNLPTVLKALHLQRVLTRFAIERQMQAAAADAESVQRLYDGFAEFIANNKPTDLDFPTQDPGVIGI
jgi:hypothetical protein